MILVSAYLCGLIMSFGLIVSGMVNPAKVIGFLNITGDFDLTLAFVMAGALMVAFLGYRWVSNKKQPLLGGQFDCLVNKKIDAQLIIGAVIFGAGWGLAGFCPAPAIVGFSLGYVEPLIFVAAMAGGMFIAKTVLKAMAR